MNANWTIWHTVGLFGSVAAIVVVGVLPQLSAVPAFYLTVGIMTAIAVVIGHGVTGFWRGILIDENNRLSLSRFQLVVWTLIILSGLLTAAFRNMFHQEFPTCCGNDPLGIQISPEVWALMGITLTSAVAAAMANQTNRKRGLRIVANNAAVEASWADLFIKTEGDAHVDMSRVQNFYFTVILVIAYTALLQQMFTLGGCLCKFPALTPGMLTLLGISHAAYIVPKAAARP